MKNPAGYFRAGFFCAVLTGEDARLFPGGRRGVLRSVWGKVFAPEQDESGQIGVLSEKEPGQTPDVLPSLREDD